MDLQQRKGEIYENNISFSWNNNMGNVQSAYPVSFYMHAVDAILVDQYLYSIFYRLVD